MAIGGKTILKHTEQFCRRRREGFIMAMAKNESRPHKFALILLSLIGMISLSSNLNNKTQADGKSLSPEAVVETFCQLDAGGQRIKSGGWVKIRPLVAWPDEPGWDNAIIISHYSIAKANTVDNKSIVTVKYFVLGSTDTIEYVKSSKVETIKFELSLKNNRWKIIRPQIPPHVNKKAIIEHLLEIQSAEKERKDQLEMLIEQIKRSQM